MSGKLPGLTYRTWDALVAHPEVFQGAPVAPPAVQPPAGPWHIARSIPALHPHRGEQHDIHDAEGRPVASALGAAGALVAAAPDLLAACRLALAAIEKHVPPTEFAPREMLAAAIAKAEGR